MSAIKVRQLTLRGVGRERREPVSIDVIEP